MSCANATLSSWFGWLAGCMPACVRNFPDFNRLMQLTNANITSTNHISFDCICSVLLCSAPLAARANRIHKRIKVFDELMSYQLILIVELIPHRIRPLILFIAHGLSVRVCSSFISIAGWRKKMSHIKRRGIYRSGCTICRLRASSNCLNWPKFWFITLLIKRTWQIFPFTFR